MADTVILRNAESEGTHQPRRAGLRGPTKETVCAVVVTFHPDSGLTERVEKIARQVSQILIVDNASGALAREQLRTLCCSLGLALIENSENRGIAAALNQGAHWAAGHSYEWMLTLDQDSIVADDMVETLLDVYEKFPAKKRLGAIGSNYVDRNSSRNFLPRGGSGCWHEVKTLITSGSLIPLSAYALNGPFREEFFVDCVDLEYCLRARSRKLKLIIARKTLMQHAVGAATMHRLPWKMTGTSNHSPMRRYYLGRNLLVLAREYLLREPIWVFSATYSLFKSAILMVFFENDRACKLKHMAMGVVDGLFGNFGRKVS